MRTRFVLPPMLVAGAWTLACGNGMPVDLGQEFVAPMEDPPSVELPPLPDAADLGDAETAAIAEYLETLSHSVSGEAAFCETLENSVGLAERLGRHLNDVREDREPDGFPAAVEALDAVLPGIAFRIGSEGVLAWRAPDELGAHTDGNSRAVLDAATAILPTPFPGWMEQTWDLGGCSAPVRVAAPLAQLAQRWSLAPACVQSALRPAVHDTLAQMADTSCFCESRKITIAGAEELIKPLEQLDDLGGRQLLGRLKRSMTAQGARFDDACGG